KESDLLLAASRRLLTADGLAAEGRMLGDDEFLDEVKHRIGEYVGAQDKGVRKPNLEAIIKAAAKASGLAREGVRTLSKPVYSPHPSIFTTVNSSLSLLITCASRGLNSCCLVC